MQNKMVRKSNYLVEASYKLSPVEQKMLLFLASSINLEDKDFKEYSLKIKDFQDSLENESENYNRLEKIILDLKEKNLKIVYPNENGVEVTLNVSWLSSSKYVDGSGVVQLCFDPSLKPFLLRLKSHFTNYRLENIVQLKSQFSIRIYELLKQYEKIGQRLFMVSELRSILGIDQNQYKQYTDFKKRVIVPAQKELAEKTDISFYFEELKMGHTVGQIRFFIKSRGREKAQLVEVESIQNVLVSQKSEPPESEDLKKLIALLPKDLREKESLRKLLKTWLEKQNVDYVARNIECANDGSNEVNPGANLNKGSNYRNYLTKALLGDYGLSHREDKETKKKTKESANRKAQEEAAAQKQRLEQVQNEKVDHERARFFQQSLPPEALEQLKAEAFSRLDYQQQEMVKKKVVGSEMMLKIMMNKVALERMKIS